MAHASRDEPVGVPEPTRSTPAQPSSGSRRSRQRSRLSVGTALAITIVTLAATGIVLHRNLRAIDRLVEQLVRVEEPTSAAALEMEINVLGTGLGVWKYIATGDAVHRERVRKDEADYRRFRAEYERLASTSVERELAARLDALHLRYSELAHALMDTRDAHVAELRAASDAFDAIDRVLDERIQPRLASDVPRDRVKLEIATAIEADVAEVGAALGVYVADPTAVHRERIADGVREVREQVSTFEGFELTPDERDDAARIAQILAPAVDAIERAVEHYDALLRDESAFIAVRNQLDDVLDEGIQHVARDDLRATAPRVKAAVDRLYVASLLVLALGALVVIAAAALLTYRSIELRAANDELRAEIARRAQAESARTRLLSELMSVEEKERSRLARELHDQMGQNLSALMLGLKGLSRPSERGDESMVAGAQIAPLHELTRQLIEQVHTIAWDLRPASLDEFGVQGALCNYIEDWTHRSGVQVDVETNLGEQRFPDAIELALYRVAQEALTNVAKHARAQHVSLTLQRQGDELVMVIEDDGEGFAARMDGVDAVQREHLGVIGMRERAALVGGSLTIESVAGSGTTLVVRIPIT